MEPETYYDEAGEDEWKRLEERFVHSIEYENTIPYLEDMLPSSGHVLDAGGAAGRYTTWLAEHGYEATLTDLSRKQLEVADRKLTDRGLRDNVTIHQDDTRPAKVHEETKNVIEQYFGTEPEEQTGRPDVIVLEVIDEAADEYDYLITEVKNSTHQDTIRQGVKETLEYLAFLHIDDSGDETDYVFEQDNMFGSGYNGVLVVQDLEQDAKAIEEQEEQSIKILQAGELKDGYGPLRDVVEEII